MMLSKFNFFRKKFDCLRWNVIFNSTYFLVIINQIFYFFFGKNCSKKLFNLKKNSYSFGGCFTIVQASSTEVENQVFNYSSFFQSYPAKFTIMQTIEQQIFVELNLYFYLSIMFFGIISAILFVSFSELLSAKHPVNAIFSFLFYLLALIVLFFMFQADYIGAVHLLVYPGAILIFFTFTTLTTEQQYQWKQWYQNEVNNFHNKTIWVLMSFLTICFSWHTFKHNLTGSSFFYFNKFENPEYLFEKILEESTSIIALGNEIFGRRPISISLLGLLLTFAFLGALKFIHYSKNVNKWPRSVFPRFGALSLFAAAAPAIVSSEYMSFYSVYSGDIYIFVVQLIIVFALAALSVRKYCYIHTFLIIECMGITLNFFYAVASAISDNLDGEVLILFAVAIAAAETAIGLAIFLSVFKK